MARNLHRDMGQPIAHGKWVLLYLNGKFWGLYNLTERIDLQFLRAYSDKEADWHVIVKESGWDELGQWYSREEVREGNYGTWLDQQNWVGSADFSNPGNIGFLEWNVDNVNLWERNIQNMLRFVDEREAVILHHLDILRYQTFTECK